MPTITNKIKVIVDQAEDFINIFNSALPEAHVEYLLLHTVSTFEELYNVLGVQTDLEDDCTYDLQEIHKVLTEVLPKYKELLNPEDTI
tara:strand:+ start:544 stop:807 length:264 start_codon:yes stop_codon:yes gene_type:complete